MNKTGITCYRNGGCGPYEMYSCYECPASKSDYMQVKTATKPQTNYDLLISKTPEELAEFFGTLPCCPPGNADELCFPDNTCGADTKMMIKCWANWLKSPVEEGNDD